MTNPKEYTMQVQDTADRKWHVSKTINVGHILTTVAAILAVLAFANRFDDRVDLLEYRADVTDGALLSEHEYVKEVFSRISDDLMYIRARIDKVSTDRGHE